MSKKMKKGYTTRLEARQSQKSKTGVHFQDSGCRALSTVWPPVSLSNSIKYGCRQLNGDFEMTRSRSREWWCGLKLLLLMSTLLSLCLQDTLGT